MWGAREGLFDSAWQAASRSRPRLAGRACEAVPSNTGASGNREHAVRHYGSVLWALTQAAGGWAAGSLTEHHVGFQGELGGQSSLCSSARAENARVGRRWAQRSRTPRFAATDALAKARGLLWVRGLAAHSVPDGTQPSGST